MPTKITPLINLIDILKLFGAVIIIYLGLSFNVSQVGESILDLFDKDYLGEEYQNYLLEDLEFHDIYYETGYSKFDFETFCLYNEKLCNKLYFDAEYNFGQKLYYLSGASYVVDGMDENMRLGKNIYLSFNEIQLQDQKVNKRAWTRGNSVFVNTNTITYDGEFIQLLSHEFGHIVDIYSIQGFSSKKDKNFTEFGREVFSIDDPSIEFYRISWNAEKIRKSGAKAEDFCSGYGMYNTFEDFAECHNLYLNHNAVFRLFARSNLALKQKYNFLANIYGGKYFNIGLKSFLVFRKKTSSWRPWDTTRIHN